jgi:hypothetical protein
MLWSSTFWVQPFLFYLIITVVSGEQRNRSIDIFLSFWCQRQIQGSLVIRNLFHLFTLPPPCDGPYISPVCFGASTLFYSFAAYAPSRCLLMQGATLPDHWKVFDTVIFREKVCWYRFHILFLPTFHNITCFWFLSRLGRWPSCVC